MNTSAGSGTPRALLDFMSDPESYPHSTEGEIEHIQTHISHVFIASPYVYKLRKPVNLDFLDFSTLDKRRDDCEREVELNRRLCKQIYLGVVPIYRRDDSYYLDSSSGNEEPAEYAVKMRKLGYDRFLSAIAERDELKPRHLDRIADKLTAFYVEQEPDEEVLQHGRIENIRVNTDENFEQTKNFIGTTINTVAYDTIRSYTSRYYETHAPLFKKRINEKRIVDGHGDLHMEHIHISDENICIYDCIEFNDRLRYLDYAADLGFLAMDLDYNGFCNLSDHFIRRMARRLDDPDLLRILDFYKCYRAYVRGKVESMTGADEEVPEEQRKEDRRKAERYFQLALRYAAVGSQPAALIVMGPIAGGKSTVADMLSENMDIEVYSSDRIRKNIAGLPLNKRTPAEDRDELYSSAMSEKTYSRLLEITEEKYDTHCSVILDATYSRSDDRKKLISKLQSLGMDYCFIEASAPPEVRKERLKNREDDSDTISDARLEDFEALQQRYTLPDELTANHLIRAETTDKPEQTLRSILDRLTNMHISRI